MRLMKKNMNKIKVNGTRDNKDLKNLLAQKVHDLRERIKELECFYELSRLDSQYELSLEDFFKTFVQQLPNAWQYPEDCCALIRYKDFECKTRNDQVTAWSQSAVIYEFGKAAGEVRVFYLKEKPRLDEGPFLKEERKLIESIARHLGAIAERKTIEQNMKESAQLLKSQKELLEHKTIALSELVDHIHFEKNEIKKNVSLNIERILLPIIKKGRMKGGLDAKQLEVLEKNIMEMLSSYSEKIGGPELPLTPREIEISNLVRSGMTSKEIADFLKLNPGTVEVHRNKIRQKLGIANSSNSLFSYLNAV